MNKNSVLFKQYVNIRGDTTFPPNTEYCLFLLAAFILKTERASGIMADDPYSDQSSAKDRSILRSVTPDSKWLLAARNKLPCPADRHTRYQCIDKSYFIWSSFFISRPDEGKQGDFNLYDFCNPSCCLLLTITNNSNKIETAASTLVFIYRYAIYAAHVCTADSGYNNNIHILPYLHLIRGRQAQSRSKFLDFICFCVHDSKYINYLWVENQHLTIDNCRSLTIYFDEKTLRANCPLNILQRYVVRYRMVDFNSSEPCHCTVFSCTICPHCLISFGKTLPCFGKLNRKDLSYSFCRGVSKDFVHFIFLLNTQYVCISSHYGTDRENLNLFQEVRVKTCSIKKHRNSKCHLHEEIPQNAAFTNNAPITAASDEEKTRLRTCYSEISTRDPQACLLISDSTQNKSDHQDIPTVSNSFYCDCIIYKLQLKGFIVCFAQDEHLKNLENILLHEFYLMLRAIARYSWISCDVQGKSNIVMLLSQVLLLSNVNAKKAGVSCKCVDPVTYAWLCSRHNSLQSSSDVHVQTPGPHVRTQSSMKQVISTGISNNSLESDGVPESAITGHDNEKQLEVHAPLASSNNVCNCDQNKALLQISTVESHVFSKRFCPLPVIFVLVSTLWLFSTAFSNLLSRHSKRAARKCLHTTRYPETRTVTAWLLPLLFISFLLGLTPVKAQGLVGKYIYCRMFNLSLT
ncbi:hypothetical protein PoB_003199000 [Plakobranchus ocellatus]|uniref:Uncharacterized protein n=1 Tax=Plakobranchus ocellatus TaxID=259542 RepID=A0AAV4ABE6_9GAST|nr:hypothetical protein PoB_003199000 [Plakobranchus ocellatus]